jgi:hypothetical protein
MSNDEVVVVFTGKSIETMRREGGSGNWTAHEARLRHCQFIVATRNMHAAWSEPGIAHGTGFLIGRISGVRKSLQEPGRLIIEFSEYADLNIPKLWPGNHNPVTYKTLEELRINPEELDWKPFGTERSLRDLDRNLAVSTSPAEVVAAAKDMIAHALSISPEAVKITIDF